MLRFNKCQLLWWKYKCTASWWNNATRKQCTDIWSCLEHTEHVGRKACILRGSLGYVDTFSAWNLLPSGIHCNQTFHSLFPSQWGWVFDTKKVTMLLPPLFVTVLSIKENRVKLINEREKRRYRPSPLRSSVRLCEFSELVITMEYIPWSFSIGSITCESSNQLFISTFMSLINGLKNRLIYWVITIIKHSDKGRCAV